MPSIPLPENASLEHLKKQAKLVQKLVASNDDGAGDLVREFHPRFADTASETPPVGFRARRRATGRRTSLRLRKLDEAAQPRRTGQRPHRARTPLTSTRTRTLTDSRRWRASPTTAITTHTPEPPWRTKWSTPTRISHLRPPLRSQ